MTIGTNWSARCSRRAPLLPGVLCFVAFLFGTGARANAQYTTDGQPWVEKNGHTMNAISPLVLDATQFGTAPDVCAQIHDAIVHMLTTQPGKNGVHNGVVDARGFIGDQQCQSNMFPAPDTTNYPTVTGKLLLGNVVLHTTATQVQPSKFQVEGSGWSNNANQTGTNVSGDSNTVVRACVSGETDCGTTSLCDPTCAAPVLWCWGTSGGCNGSNPPYDNAYGSLTQYMAFDCAGLANCTAMQAVDVVEGTGCWHCQFHGWGNKGIGLDICGGSAGCQNSSWEDLSVVISTGVYQSDFAGYTCSLSTVGGVTYPIPIRVNTGANGAGGHYNFGPKVIKGVSVDAANCNCTWDTGHQKCTGQPPYPYDSFRLSTEMTTVQDVLLGQATTVGLRLGGDGDVDGVTVINVQSGPTYGGTLASGNQCGTSSKKTTTVLLDSGNVIDSTTLLSVGDGQSPGNNGRGPATDIIKDCFNKRNSLPFEIVDGSANYTQHVVASYILSNNGKNTHIINDVEVFPSGLQLGLNTIAATAAAMDLTTGNVQQLACPSAGTTVSVTVSNQLPGMELTFMFVQIASGLPCFVAFPSNMHGASTVSSANGSVTTQKFIASNNGSDLYAEGAASVCLPGVPPGTTCGTP